MEGHFSTPRHPRLRWSHHGATRQKYDHKRKWTSHCAADRVPGHYCLCLLQMLQTSGGETNLKYSWCFPYAPIPSASGLGVGFRYLNTFSQGIWSTRAWRYLPIFVLQHVVLLKETFPYRFRRMTLTDSIDFVASTVHPFGIWGPENSQQTPLKIDHWKRRFLLF